MSLVLSYNEVVQVGLRIASSVDLTTFCVRATATPRVGKRLEDLRIVINAPVTRASLQRCLTLAPNLVDLDLLLSNPDIPGILDGVVLRNLRFFRTNLPHHLLPAFFAAHARISVLVLDACHAPDCDCPLGATHLPHLKCISGPAPCVTRFVNNGLTRLTMSSPDDGGSTSLVLRSLPLRLYTLCTLTIDFGADDHDVLQSVIASFPAIRKLKLLEKPSEARGRTSTRRAWNNTATWSKDLLSLPLLEELMLRTGSTLVRRSASEDEERKAIMRWVSGLRSATRGRPHYHPSLYHIGVWYRSDDNDNGVVTHWSQHAGAWVRASILLHPPQDYDFV
ncbi:hypothetical protein K466DRAFT_605746 [Polyporus arcularius HHB13444]|uniref:F-box domain-containing protein n=1 Tax=Polyporus arcularius HHB13444 TaxID=1314778 RepID=A0A5C3NVA6_9APHY|nr:hypothetical protein K466DRAFT_605746 [Polyporus arcularius HHB13444]